MVYPPFRAIVPRSGTGVKRPISGHISSGRGSSEKEQKVEEKKNSDVVKIWLKKLTPHDWRMIKGRESAIYFSPTQFSVWPGGD
jgi:hypothetical protein